MARAVPTGSRGPRVLAPVMVVLAALGVLTGCGSGAAPTIRAVRAGDRHAIVYWSAPPADGDLTITGYVVTPYLGSTPQRRTSFGASTRGGVIAGLHNGSRYTFVVQALNDLGGSSAQSPPSLPAVPSVVATSGVTELDHVNDGMPVAIFGDSITLSALPQVRAATRGTSVRFAAWFGEGWSGGPWSDVVGVPHMRRIAGQWAGSDPAVVVFSLGTNDARSTDLSLESALSAMDEMIGRFPDACLAGVEVNEISPATGYQHAEAAAINAAMRDRLDVTTVWVTSAGLLPDGIHANAIGQERFVDSVVDAIVDCAT